MGLKIFSDDSCESTLKIDDSKIVYIREFGKYTVAGIRYPSCKTHNGLKILIFLATKQEVMDHMPIDPHFLGGGFSPIARFSPDIAGTELLTILTDGLLR